MSGDSWQMNLRTQRRLWEEQGFLVVSQALSSSEIAGILKAVDGALEAKHGSVFSQQAAGVKRKSHAFKIATAITQTDSLDPLLDHPAVFDLLLEFVGPYLQVMGTEIFVRLHGAGAEPLVEWHCDGGPAMTGWLATPGHPVLQMKVQYFLTDLSQSDSGNFMCVPGSHLRPFPKKGFRAQSPPPGAIQIHARPGDAILFPFSLWHGVAPNRSGCTRKSVAIRYGPMWSRPYDYEHLPARVLARMTPRRRRLLGDLGKETHPSSYFYPDDAEHLRLMHNKGAAAGR
jgi:ectoine hydroxylase-related dioxygenase (phytanoyl-CoA dioxygenase family)